MIYPLNAQLSEDSSIVNLSEVLLNESVTLSDSIKHIGTGIGSIFLLIVVIYYIISIMDGGKFQMKMLIPLVLFFLVGNFTWVAKPVLMFTTTITQSLSEAFSQKRESLLNQDGETGISTINDHYVVHNLEADPTAEEGDPTAQMETASGADSDSNSNVGNSKMKTFINTMTKAMKYSTNIGIIWDFAVSANKTVYENLTSERLSFVGILCHLMSWLCTAVSFCLRVFGIMMTAIMVAFGPIVFAFAILPGRGSNIVSWFIRICQFSLFVPLCSYIDTFIVSSYLVLGKTSAMGFLMVFALTLANIVGLISVPTIASMIIEGASGAVSLSQGLQTITGAAMTTGGFMVGATAGQDNGVQNFMAGFKHKGMVGFVKEMGKKTYDSSGNETGRAGFMGAVKNIAAYGQGSLYGWNVQDGNHPSQNNNQQPNGNSNS